MPVYDCGAADCEECQRAFGPDRSKAIAAYEARDQAMIDAAWEKHKAAGPCEHDPVLDAKSGIHVCAKCGRGVKAVSAQ